MLKLSNEKQYFTKYLESSGDSGKLEDIVNGVGEVGCK